MTLLPANFSLPLSSPVKVALGARRAQLCGYINKYDADIPIILSGAGEVVREAHSFLYEKHRLSRGISSARTVQTYAESLKHWFEYCDVNNQCWQDLNVRSLVKYRNSMKSGSSGSEKSLRPATINLRVTVVAEFLKFFVSEGLADRGKEIEAKNFLANLGRARLKLRRTQSRPVALSAEDCRSICSRLSGAHRIIFIWALSTGLRTSSILSTSLEKFEGVKGSTGGFVELVAKGGKWQKVFLSSYILEETRKYIRIERKLSLLRGNISADQSNSLFLNRNGSPVERRCYYTAYKRACKTVDVSSHPHQTRTTFATFMDRRLRTYSKQNNVDHIKIIQGLLGHASSSTTQDYLESIEINNIEILSMLEDHALILRGEHE